MLTPALFTRMSIRPNRSSVRGDHRLHVRGRGHVDRQSECLGPMRGADDSGLGLGFAPASATSDRDPRPGRGQRLG